MSQPGKVKYSQVTQVPGRVTSKGTRSLYNFISTIKRLRVTNKESDTSFVIASLFLPVHFHFQFTFRDFDGAGWGLVLPVNFIIV